MKKFVFALAATAVATLAQAQTKWDLPSGYGANTFHVQNLQYFADEVDKATSGKLKITLHPGASLFKANEIKRAVQSGQAPIGEFILSGASNENALFGIDAIPFLATTYSAAKKLNDISNPYLEKLLASQGLKLLYAVPWPGQSLYSTKAITSFQDLKGTKMRAYNPATTRIAELVGAQPVTIQLAELGQALATGAVDNFLTSSSSGVDSKLHEHAKFFYDVNAWLPRNALVVNQKAFDALDQPTQAAVVKIAAVAQARGWKESERQDDENLKVLESKGMKVDRGNEALKRELKVIGDRITGEWLRNASADGKAALEAYRATQGK
ncbi:MAG: TRAP transporter substrate-binding protein [Hydrogenophaga sp.]|uniref:TRAP transporter substrate-binding protein n=1 Tax=Hydrogenophaga sp. TaxID=1904254 RepID=UPI002773C591|nr:TRAP transporter substrate-binding protein [Hydrogenophaga sp.]MDP2417530.1 TRAP transporter substrate-binding protein [Hydrogenophaga sp.]MDZ4189599.1 TRAP transporter substrate-binding protein [Hydrogenophaga sp.]